MEVDVPRRKIALLFCDQDNPFWVDTVSAYRELLPSYNIDGDLFFTEPPRDGNAQSELLSRILKGDYDAVIVNPLDGHNLIKSIALSGDKTPIFDVGPKCDGDEVQRLQNYIPLYATDFEEQGRLCMEALLAFQVDGPVAFIGGPLQAEQGKQRVQGALNRAEADGLKVISPVWSDFTLDGGRESMKSLLPFKPEVLFCANDLMALGALQILSENNVHIPVGGVDLTTEAVEAIKSGDMAVSVGLDCFELVKEVLKAVTLYLTSGGLPSFPLVGNRVILSK